MIVKLRVAISLEPGDPAEVELALAISGGETLLLTHLQGMGHIELPTDKPLTITATVMSADGVTPNQDTHPATAPKAGEVQERTYRLAAKTSKAPVPPTNSLAAKP